MFKFMVTFIIIHSWQSNILFTLGINLLQKINLLLKHVMCNVAVVNFIMGIQILQRKTQY